MLTANQTQRVWEITRQWNAIRGPLGRDEATPAEVVEFLITQEEIGIKAMLDDDAAEEKAVGADITNKLQQEDLAS
jgi:hypothetical protein